MRKLLASLTLGQRVAIVLVVALAGAGIYALARWQKEKDFRPLYTGLSPEDAGAVVQRLKESGTDYRLSEDGRTVLAPSGRVAELRLAMAAAGLPRNGRIGFELFDKTNFGATEFSEQVNYRRALEGELERSVMSLAAVEQARVHLTFPKESVFLEARQPAKASVLVKLRPGARLTAANAAAVSHLVASAVEGLAPEAVTILDMQGNLLNRPRRQTAGEEGMGSEATLEYRQAVERDVAAKIANTLEPLLGPDKFRVSVAAECDFTSGEQSEESFDPSRSVMLASQKTEEYASSGGAARNARDRIESSTPRSQNGRERHRPFASNREHHLPVQPHRAAHPHPARSRQTDVGGGGGGSRGELERGRRRPSTDSDAAFAGEAESDSGVSLGGGGPEPAAGRSNHRRKLAF